MVSWFSQASGIIIMIASGSERPESISSSATSSKDCESEAPTEQIGNSSSGLRPSSGDFSWDCRARIQLRLPLTVLISPLCAMVRKGWASGQEGKVLVENRECTIARRVVNRGSDRSG
ncbi:Uncharacterised protein [Mycobacteroides abscessus subsp. abscessus]|nr:Uncharacterised protein [Mycobacteroides abscessus subsp. abscessus]